MRALPYIAVLVVLVMLPALVSNYYVDLTAKILIFAVFAMSLNLVLGHAGLFTLGHALYFGLAAYTAGIIAIVIGASAGIGRAYALALAGAGATVVAAASRSDRSHAPTCCPAGS